MFYYSGGRSRTVTETEGEMKDVIIPASVILSCSMVICSFGIRKLDINNSIGAYDIKHILLLCFWIYVLSMDVSV